MQTEEKELKKNQWWRKADTVKLSFSNVHLNNLSLDILTEHVQQEIVHTKNTQMHSNTCMLHRIKNRWGWIKKQ